MLDVVCDIRCALGEGPLWSVRDNAIYWVDILSALLYRRRLTESIVDVWQMPEKIGWIVERRHHLGFVAGLQSGFHLITLDPLCYASIGNPEPDLPGNRMNDAKVDHLGRIWAGTMDSQLRRSTGSLYRLNPALGISKHDTGYLVTNGPAFDADRRRMYHSDTKRRLVYCFDMTVSGDIRNKRVFIRFRDAWGFPDGMTVDADGGLWIAHWGGGRVTRFTPDGEAERHIQLPASQITSCAFGGKNLDRLFITSAADGQPAEPEAGMLFVADPGVTGQPPGQFAG